MFFDFRLSFFRLIIPILLFLVTLSFSEKKEIKVIYIPLADHYALLVAYENYAKEMKYADLKIEQMGSWPELRAYFMSGEVDMAGIICPQAMDMFLEDPKFRWVSLMHRDGNALAINDHLNKHVNLSKNRIDRKPDSKIAEAFSIVKKETGIPSKCGVPSIFATHTVVLYKYLKDHGKTLALKKGDNEDVIAVAIAPPKSPVFLKQKNARGIAASFEQSLPWADIVETENYGYVGWYSKDVIVWPKGHVECIAIAQDKTIKEKHEALKEVIYYIHQAGLDIEIAKQEASLKMDDIVKKIRKHIPKHNANAITQSLRSDLNVINYYNLNIDKSGLKLIMDLAVEGKILKTPIDINGFADDQFSTKITIK